METYRKKDDSINNVVVNDLEFALKDTTVTFNVDYYIPNFESTAIYYKMQFCAAQNQDDQTSFCTTYISDLDQSGEIIKTVSIADVFKRFGDSVVSPIYGSFHIRHAEENPEKGNTIVHLLYHSPYLEMNF
ncbi:MAG: hypothetical protein HQK83_08825 [Fibrobacteria bacterium]|nr:hypothetical protein [Fibrobacteria bacterium]